jgi:hypothetical protein
MANKKGRIVTKEELEKSGYTNLRDFLNAERGLKRRDGKAPERKVPPEAKKVMDRMRMDRASNMRAQARKADVEMETPEERGAMNLKGFMKDKADKRSEKFRSIASANTYGLPPIEDKKDKGSLTDEDRKRARLDSAREASQAGMYGTMKKGGAVKMKAGGKVSASKRADGCAQRGKTRGKVI